MWVMTSFGIFMPGLRPADTIPQFDERQLQIRSRRAEDLDKLRERYMGDSLGENVKLPNTDYEYRAYCTHEAWANALAGIAMDMDYVKFKETAEDKDLHDVYLSIWGVVYRGMSANKSFDQEYTHYYGEQTNKKNKKGKR